MSREHVASILLIVLLGAAAYINVVDGEFIWDDKRIVEQNELIRSPSNIARVFTKDVGGQLASGGGGVKYNFYRPAQMLTYMADYAVWKDNPAGYHITNILIHILAALCLYRLVNIISGHIRISLVAAVLFVVHPLHTEAVAYISGRADPLSVVFLLAAFIVYVKGLQTSDFRLQTFIVLILYTLAILSRESALIFPVLLLAYHYAYRKKIDLPRFLPIAVLTAAGAAFRFFMTGQLLGGDKIPSGAFFSRVPGAFAAIANYARLLVIPFNLHMEYGNARFSMIDPAVIIGVIITLALAAYIFKKRDTRGPYVFGVLWFIAALLPSLNLYPIGAYMAEHWLYLPSIAVFMMAGVCFGRWQTRRQNGDSPLRTRAIQTGTVPILIIYFLTLTVNQNFYWRRLIPFYEKTLEYAPESVRIYNNLGVAYHDKAQYAMAAEAYKKAIELNPNYFETFCNLGTAYHDMGLYDEAIAEYKREIAINPDYPKVHNNLGTLYFDTGRYEEAIASYEKALALDPDKMEIISNLAMSYHRSKRYDEALRLYETAAGIDSEDARIYFNIAIAYEALGRPAEALRPYKRAIEIDPEYAEVHNNLAILYFRMGRYDMAVVHSDRAREFGHAVSPVFLRDLKARIETVTEGGE
jgi:tetratricopeptide (TPR) repeat protein